jgi:hypothetical protein
MLLGKISGHTETKGPNKGNDCWVVKDADYEKTGGYDTYHVRERDTLVHERSFGDEKPAESVEPGNSMGGFESALNQTAEEATSPDSWSCPNPGPSDDDQTS